MRVLLLFFLWFLPLFAKISDQELQFSIHQPYKSEPIAAFIFAHGLGATKQQGITLFAKNPILKPDEKIMPKFRWLIDEPLISFNFLDAKNDNNDYHRKKVNLGQHEDMQHLSAAYEKTREVFPGKKVILAGISRGAATIVNFAGEYQPEGLGALVLESPFDTLSSVIKHLLARYKISWFPFSEKIGYKICQTHFPNIDTKGIFPIGSVEKIKKDLPIFLIHSKRDRVIPINSSRNLYLKLKENGHEHVYLAELASGDHGKTINGADGDFYCAVIHAFYKRYELPYDTEFASKGEPLLHLCQPTIEEIKHRIRKKRTIEEFDEEPDEEVTFFAQAILDGLENDENLEDSSIPT